MAKIDDEIFAARVMGLITGAVIGLTILALAKYVFL